MDASTLTLSQAHAPSPEEEDDTVVIENRLEVCDESRKSVEILNSDGLRLLLVSHKSLLPLCPCSVSPRTRLDPQDLNADSALFPDIVAPAHLDQDAVNSESSGVDTSPVSPPYRPLTSP